MKQWRRVEVNSTFSIGHPVICEMDIAEDVRMRERHALGFAGRSTGVNERKECLRVVDWVRSAVIERGKRLLVDYNLPGNCHCRDWKGRVTHKTARLSILEDVINFNRREPSVNGYCNHAE